MIQDNFAHRAADWDSPEKTKMTETFVTELLKHIHPQPHWKALEVGAGTGLVGMQLLPYLDTMIFEDTSEAMLSVLAEKIRGNEKTMIVHGEVFDYTQKDIDLVFSCMAFHHIPEMQAAINHIATITKQNGLVVVGDLLTEDGSFHRFEPIPHKGFDLEVFSSQFRSAGFEIELAQPYNVLKRERVDGVISEYTQFILIARRLQ